MIRISLDKTLNCAYYKVYNLCLTHMFTSENIRHIVETYVESELIFLVDDKSNFTDSCLRLRVACAELIALVKHASGDDVCREVERTCSHSWNGHCFQLAFVRLRQNVLDEVSENLNNTVQRI